MPHKMVYHVFTMYKNRRANAPEPYASVPYACIVHKDIWLDIERITVYHYSPDVTLDYNPNHLPVIPTDIQWVIGKEILGIIHHSPVKWVTGNLSEVLYYEKK